MELIILLLCALKFKFEELRQTVEVEDKSD